MVARGMEHTSLRSGMRSLPSKFILCGASLLETIWQFRAQLSGAAAASSFDLASKLADLDEQLARFEDKIRNSGLTKLYDDVDRRGLQLDPAVVTNRFVFWAAGLVEVIECFRAELSQALEAEPVQEERLILDKLADLDEPLRKFDVVLKHDALRLAAELQREAQKLKM